MRGVSREWMGDMNTYEGADFPARMDESPSRGASSAVFTAMATSDLS
jgi:hypothetical protein